ncbi:MULTISPECIES: pyridoxal phosphate-dependent decarboxylase family protein [Cupriavidus]|uniref:pyridoxal phosphate-dependent decarboxylase family protein n=1 Tax=Cupriavidus TaxID=106589 RepID=UPI00044B56AC|nr:MULTISPECIES: pyridoxal-dependent decarboxylase [Cupriavidus]KDP84047.1 pyridoxal-dependent decarboxylase [Cupriavidus sp. SK-3]MDF3888183.1 pyridoxal-dependent decarboxylase [Cupriavidus basilensis]
MSHRQTKELDVLKHAAEAAERFREAVATQPPAASYAACRQAWDSPTPETGTPAAQTIDALRALAEPGLQPTTGPRFFGWVVGASHPVGVAADWLTSAWGQNCANHQGSPSAAAAEDVAARWLLDILRLPASASVGFVTGATMANFTCLAAARTHVLQKAGWDVEAQGLCGAPEIHVLIGDEAHTTVFAALRLLGFGRDRIKRVPSGRDGAMLAEPLRAALAACEGPAIVIAQAGQINTGAFDPVQEMLADIRARGAWLHVDGAFGLWARACPETAALAAGLEAADSWATDGHKWLQTPYDSGYAIVAHPDAHRRALTAAASYLPHAAGDERDPSQYVPELSRRARGFATWAMLRHLGRAGIADMVARHCRLARRMAARLEEEAGITVLNRVSLNQVIVSFGAGRDDATADRLTRHVVARVQSAGDCYVGGACWKGREVMRLSVISWPTGEDDIDRAAESIVEAWRYVARLDP